jgi:hypothetical protein
VHLDRVDDKNGDAVLYRNPECDLTPAMGVGASPRGLVALVMDRDSIVIVDGALVGCAGQ